MKARPILFSAPMVRALLDGTKTQTRRAVKPQPPAAVTSVYRPFPVVDPTNWQGFADGDGLIHWYGRCPYGAPGDLLWVRETWAAQEAFDAMSPSEIGAAFADEHGEPWCPIRYAADGKCEGSVDQWQESPLGKTRVSIHMPRWASRLTLEITDVRVERLQAISEVDAVAEGIEHVPDGTAVTNSPYAVRVAENAVCCGETARAAYLALWNYINGPGADADNPWVWALSFKVHRANVEAVLSGRAA